MACLVKDKVQISNPVPQQPRANDDGDSGYERVAGHILRSLVHGPRGIVHALLGSQVIYLALASFLFVALTGLGGFIISDDLNREGKRQFVGLSLLGLGPRLAAVCLSLGCPEDAPPNPSAAMSSQARRGIGARTLR